MCFFYFDIDHAVGIHDWIIENSGGREGVLNIGNLESPLCHVQNDEYYPQIEDKLTFLVYSINKNHAFEDGNKRSSIALGAYFLQLNGYGYVVSRFVRNMENIAVWVADNKVGRELLQELLVSILYEDDFSETLKLKLIMAIH
ncbi:Fic family protein [Pseudomonas syringae pv. actinidiae]|uniref:Prophage maintenance system killer protein n=1 Tax=Pseudomonas syringae pv. actinidiae TaxID=103796 RepID=A0AAN4QFQ7_PSESF|nr:Fic family protein [Pseudomonas syringae]MDG6394741.1 Fic family protein [Pseudomonas syringae pv. actinidiae]MDG6413015.1 Fic family protein [Pseudomonas syringae pv. actinidiae]MDG6418386.1 Fic family protein [Pseudomonas syringae pv. actinidiae]MDG6423915.1 Fic family protein [Pseudomonas syringae pv. actinidiae]MDG6433944.1 Fic family protein [Pseudomonas syringae pv. actinidiae]